MGGIKSIRGPMTTVIKEGWMIAAKKIGLEVGKKAATEMVKELVNLGIDRALIPQIEAAIRGIITPIIIDSLQKNENIQKWLEIDAKNRNSKYQALIIKIAMEIISDEKSKGAFRQIAEGITDRVLSENFKSYEYIKKGVQAHEILTFTHEFLEKFEKKINKEAKNMEKSEEKDVTVRESAVEG